MGGLAFEWKWARWVGLGIAVQHRHCNTAQLQRCMRAARGWEKPAHMKCRGATQASLAWKPGSLVLFKTSGGKQNYSATVGQTKEGKIRALSHLASRCEEN
eukprot:EG_transcript_37667